MKLLETLTNQQQIDMLNGQIVGIFPTMISPSDLFYSKAKDICLGYYTNRSGCKNISRTFKTYIELTEMNPSITKSADEIIGEVIRGKFIDKWNRIYNILVKEQYDVLNNQDIKTIKTGQNKRVDGYNSSVGKKGNNTDVTTYDTNVEDNGKKGTNETVKRNANDMSDVYGFNSPQPIHDSFSTNIESETVVGEADKNTTHNKQTKTGSETKVFGLNETEIHNGSDTRDTTINETDSVIGRDKSGAKLVKEELNLRNTEIFFDIIYRDIDSIATLQIY